MVEGIKLQKQYHSELSAPCKQLCHELLTYEFVLSQNASNIKIFFGFFQNIFKWHKIGTVLARYWYCVNSPYML